MSAFPSESSALGVGACVLICQCSLQLDICGSGQDVPQLLVVHVGHSLGCIFFFYYFSLSLLVPPHLFLLYKEHCPSLSLCLCCLLCGCRVWCCVATGSLLWASAFCWSVCKPAQRVPPKSCGYREAEGLNLEAGCPPALTVTFVLFFFRRDKMILQIRLYRNRAGEGVL